MAHFAGRVTGIETSAPVEVIVWGRSGSICDDGSRVWLRSSATNADNVNIAELPDAAAYTHVDFRLRFDAQILDAAGVQPRDASTAGHRSSPRPGPATDEAAGAEWEVGGGVG